MCLKRRIAVGLSIQGDAVQISQRRSLLPGAYDVDPILAKGIDYVSGRFVICDQHIYLGQTGVEAKGIFPDFIMVRQQKNLIPRFHQMAFKVGHFHTVCAESFFGVQSVRSGKDLIYMKAADGIQGRLADGAVGFSVYDTACHYDCKLCAAFQVSGNGEIVGDDGQIAEVGQKLCKLIGGCAHIDGYDVAGLNIPMAALAMACFSFKLLVGL